MRLPKPILHFCLFAFFLFFNQILNAQGEASQWFLYHNQHYSFSNHTFRVLPQAPINIGNPSTSISDSAGNFILLLANGIIYDRNYKKLPFYDTVSNPLNLSSSNAYFVKKPGSATKYYLFYTANPSFQTGVYYKLIDLSLNNGNGDITASDVLIDKGTSPGFTVTFSYSNDEFWIVTHKKNTNNFNSWHVTSSGIDGKPVQCTAGMDANTFEYNYFHLKTSPNGKMIAGVSSYYYTGMFPFYRRFAEIYDFDASSGKVSTHVKSIDDGYVAAGEDDVEFSADSRLLYVKFDYFAPGLQPCGFSGGNLWQFNVCYTDSVSFSNYKVWLGNFVSFCSYPFWGNLQLAPDKKIYMPYTGGANATSIQNPNVIGSFSNYEFSTSKFSIEGNTELPSFYHYYLEKAVTNNIVYSGGCYPSPLHFSITNDTLKYVEWNFDDAATGANNISTLAKPSHSFSSPGMYNVSAIIYNDQKQPYDTIYNLVEIKDPSKRLLTGLPKDTFMCEGQKFPVGLSVVNGIFYWHVRYMGRDNMIGTTDSVEIGDWGDGTYIVEMHQNDCDGCILKDSITFHTKKTPEIYLGDSAKLCSGDSVQLYTYNPGAETIWSTGDSTQSIWVSKPGIYWAQAEYNHNGCIVRDTVQVKQTPGVKFSLPPDTTLCNNETLVLKPGVNNAYYSWQDYSTKNSYTVTQAGKYWVRITNYYGCSASDTINVSYVSADAVNLGNDTSLCEGDSLLLQSNVSNASYTWSTGANTASVYVNKTGNYWLKVSNGACTVIDTIHVTFNKKPVFYLGNDTALCDKQTLLLNPGLTGNYLWQDGSSNNSYSITNAGLYWLKLIQNNCSSVDSIDVSYKSLPQLNLGNDTGFCEGQSLILNAYDTSINNYLWQDNSMQPNFLVTNGGIYSVQVTSYNGCINNDTITISIAQPPVFSLGADTVLCDTKILAYNFNIPGASYLWNDGNTGSNYIISRQGSYSLTVSQSGCSSSDTINVNYNPSPLVDLGNDTTLCSGGTYTLSAYNAGANYLWQDNTNASTYTVTKSGTYNVLVDLNGCTNADTTIVYYKTAPVFSLSADSLICPGQSITLIATTPGVVSYKWQDGSTLDHYVITAAGMYSVQVTNECGTTTKAISIISGSCQVEMPTAFTPNHDGLNDIFRVKYPGFIKEFHMIIYNRWGAKVFETTDAHKGWDGNVNAIPQNIGSYVWVITFTDSNNKTQTTKGIVSLLR